ncbi:MAG TPA: type II secretion system F family protein, partial [Actinomycetota bacterium]|nr:type II secretion system F family protein [Actinomycetota bacterium]
MAETYAYRVRDRAGRLQNGTLVADSEQLVLTRLREMGMVPISVEVKKEGLSREIRVFGTGIKLKDLVVFSRQFATMINSGLSLLRSLAILEQQTENKRLGAVLAEVRLDVERGASLSQALSKHPRVFNRLYVAMVRAGEAGGVLDTTLLRLADTLERELSLRQRVKSAMTYPIVVAAFVMLILAAMLLFIVPQFKDIYTQLHGVLPLPTRILLFVSDVFRKWWWVWILIVIGLIFAFRRFKKTPQGRAAVDAFKLKVPVFGGLFHKTALSRFSSTLSILLRAGVPILQSLDIVTETVNNRVIARAVADVETSVKEGESIARPLGKHAVFPPMVVQMLAV